MRLPETLHVALGNIIPLAARLLGFALVANALSADDFGRYAIVVSAITIGAELGRVGLGRAGNGWLGTFDGATRDARAGAMSSALLVTGAGGAVIGAFVGLALGLDPIPAVAVGAWILGESIRLPLSESLRIRGRVAAATWLGDAARSIAVLVGLVLVIVLWDVSTLDTFIVLNAAVSMAVAGTNLGITRPKFDRIHSVAAARYGVKALPVSVANMASRAAEPLLAGAFLSLATTGVYFAASRMIGVIAVLPLFIGTLVQPQLVGLDRATSQAKTELSTRIVQLSRAMTAFAVIAVVVAAVAGAPLLRRLLDADGPLVAILLILGAGQIVNAASGPGGQALLLNGEASQVSRVSLLTLGFVMVGGAAGAALGGVVGLAIVSAVALSFNNIALTLIAERELRIKLSPHVA